MWNASGTEEGTRSVWLERKAGKRGPRAGQVCGASVAGDFDQLLSKTVTRKFCAGRDESADRPHAKVVQGPQGYHGHPRSGLCIPEREPGNT